MTLFNLPNAECNLDHLLFSGLYFASEVINLRKKATLSDAKAAQF